MFFIAANFFNWSDTRFRWLVWAADRGYETAVACTSLNAVDVEFLDGSQHSENVAGFGCMIVARARQVELFGNDLMEDDKPDTPLEFYYNQFTGPTGETVYSVKSLFLGRAGEMVAKLTDTSRQYAGRKELERV